MVFYAFIFCGCGVNNTSHLEEQSSFAYSPLIENKEATSCSSPPPGLPGASADSCNSMVKRGLQFFGYCIAHLLVTVESTRAGTPSFKLQEVMILLW